MLHQELLDPELIVRLDHEHPVVLAPVMSEPCNDEDAEPAISPWALAAAVAGNVIAGGAFLGALWMAPSAMSWLLSAL